MITGTGMCVPDRVLTNSDLEKLVETSDQWIKERTGMEVRHIVEEGVFTSDLAAEAGRRALEDAGLTPDQIDVIILGTVTGDLGFPSTACFVQEKLGAVNAAAMDIAAACSGFLYALTLGDALIASGRAQRVLAIGAETLSLITDYEDRATCVLFGDGAGAAVLEPARENRGVLATYMKSDGRLHHLLYMPGGGVKHRPSPETIAQRMFFIKMEGREVFKYAVTAMGEAAELILEKSGLTSDQVDLLIPHQANRRILDATAKRVGIPQERLFVNVDKYGNTSAASIPIALDEARRSGRAKAGDVVVMVAFGAGFTWASAAVRL
ncbi:MAG: ketoacyl-ACP synthase III [Calditrichaeota bacterium]|nr:ketoacyl-ACP synthase III [Calditrichota bacterium]